jgi:hypothetical protein
MIQTADKLKNEPTSSADSAQNTVSRELCPGERPTARNDGARMQSLGGFSNQSMLQRLCRKGRDQDQAPGEVPPNVYEELNRTGEPLEKNTREKMEPLFGQDFSTVRIHTGQQAAESAASVSARAYTVGQDIVFGAGEYSPSTSEGQKTLAHELTHTIQQGSGVKRIPSSIEITSPTDASEVEAHDAAASVMRGEHIGSTVSVSTGVARDPQPPAPPPPAAAAKKKVQVNVTNLFGAGGSISTALTYANTRVYNQANIEIQKNKEVTLDETKSKAILGNDLILDEFTDSAHPTAEEQALCKENQTAGMITTYFIKGFSRGSIGEDFRPGQGNGLLGVIVGGTRSDNTFSHELGHVLLDDGSHVVPDDTYLMHATAADPTKLTPEQITKMKASPFVK